MPTLDLGPLCLYAFCVPAVTILLLVLAGICIKSSAGFGEVANVVVRNTTVRSKYAKALESVVLRSATHVHTHTLSLSFALHPYCFERGCAVDGHFDTCWAVCPHTSGPLRSSSGPTRMRTATIWCFRTLPFGTPTGGWASSSGKVALPPTPSPIARSPSVAFLAQLPVLPTSHVGPSSVPLGVTSWGRSTHILTHTSPPTPTPFGGVHVQIKWKRVQRAV